MKAKAPSIVLLTLAGCALAAYFIARRSAPEILVSRSADEKRDEGLPSQDDPKSPREWDSVLTPHLKKLASLSKDSAEAIDCIVSIESLVAASGCCESTQQELLDFLRDEARSPLSPLVGILLGRHRSLLARRAAIEFLSSRTSAPAGLLIAVGFALLPYDLENLGGEARRFWDAALQDTVGRILGILSKKENSWHTFGGTALAISAFTEVVGKLEDKELSLALLGFYLRQDAPPEQYSALEILDFSSPEIVEEMRAAYPSAGAQVKQTLIALLSESKDLRTSALVLDALQTETSPEVRSALLGYVLQDDSVSMDTKMSLIVTEYPRHPPDSRESLSLIKAASHINNMETVQWLWKRASGPSPIERETATEALRTSYNETDEVMQLKDQILRAVLQDESPRVRIKAVSVLVWRKGGKASLAELRRIAESDPDPDVRNHAQWLLDFHSQYNR